jgi:hypothetical protein
LTLCSTPLAAQQPNWVLTSPVNVPPPRFVHAMAYDDVRSQVVLFGGANGLGFHNDTWVWDGTNWTQKSPTNRPSPRWFHLMAYDAARREAGLCQQNRHQDPHSLHATIVFRHLQFGEYDDHLPQGAARGPVFPRRVRASATTARANPWQSYLPPTMRNERCAITLN